MNTHMADMDYMDLDVRERSLSLITHWISVQINLMYSHSLVYITSSSCFCRIHFFAATLINILADLHVPNIREFDTPSWCSWTWELTYWGRDKMAAISQTTFSNAFSWLKMHKFQFRLYLALFAKLIGIMVFFLTTAAKCGPRWSLKLKANFVFCSNLVIKLYACWSLFPRVQLTIFQHWFRKWLSAELATSPYLNQWCPRLYHSASVN